MDRESVGGIIYTDLYPMQIEFVLEDPEHIVGQMTYDRDLIYSPHLELTPFDCDLEATRRYLPQ